MPGSHKSKRLADIGQEGQQKRSETTEGYFSAGIRDFLLAEGGLAATARRLPVLSTSFITLAELRLREFEPTAALSRKNAVAFLLSADGKTR